MIQPVEHVIAIDTPNDVWFVRGLRGRGFGGHPVFDSHWFSDEVSAANYRDYLIRNGRSNVTLEGWTLGAQNNSK